MLTKTLAEIKMMNGQDSDVPFYGDVLAELAQLHEMYNIRDDVADQAAWARCADIAIHGILAKAGIVTK